MAKIKGSAMIDVVKFLRTRREEATAALPQELQHYLQHKVLASSWYPEEDLVVLLQVLAKFFPGQAGIDIYDVIGTATANQHLTGIYQGMVKNADVTSLPSRLQALWKTQHDSGQLILERIGARHVRMQISDFGHPSRELCKILTAYLRESYHLVGVETPQVAKIGCILDGDPTCTWEITWTESDGPDC